MKRFLLSATLFPILTGCAYVTAVPTSPGSAVRGIRINPPKAFVVVNGAGVSSFVVPDCAREYAIQFGSVFAKNDTTLDISNGMLTKLDNKQDSTAFPLKLVDAVTEAAKVGKSLGTAFSTKVEGGVTDRFGIFEVSCENGRLTLSPAVEPGQLSTLATSKTPPSVIEIDGPNEGAEDIPN
ncbi:hypothetical protein [Sphingosinicella sp. LY1275]|uniref:hypothetical protein n=1 Tax=Sphingosinicella sp. LY1275 TaxID=3095379 RepID=UPI002ADEBCD5|nr:hypothetical protein [Sphingosinicella sp. LY1275]MEA1015271.1 hypothetical protein [Sphingosinicella sp. LY1275]